MSDEAGFIHAMREEPDDPNLRLVFADWLEEHEDPDRRPELLRLMDTLTQKPWMFPKGRNWRAACGACWHPASSPSARFGTNSIGMTFALIPAGTFLMGSPEKKKSRSPDKRTTAQGYADQGVLPGNSSRDPETVAGSNGQ